MKNEINKSEEHENNMIGYIYITTNKKNGMRYVGKKTSDKFLGNKYLGSGSAIKNAIDTWGKESFTVKLLEECRTQTELDILEVYYLWYYEAVESMLFYNTNKGNSYDWDIRGFNLKCKHCEKPIDELIPSRRHDYEYNYGGNCLLPFCNEYCLSQKCWGRNSNKYRHWLKIWKAQDEFTVLSTLAEISRCVDSNSKYSELKDEIYILEKEHFDEQEQERKEKRKAEELNTPQEE